MLKDIFSDRWKCGVVINDKKNACCSGIMSSSRLNQIVS